MNLLESRGVSDSIIKIISFSKHLVLFWDRKIVVNEGTAWGRMGVYLGENIQSIYFFRYIEYVDISLSIYCTYRYILGDISIYTRRYIDIYWLIDISSVIYRLIDISMYIFRFAIPATRIKNDPYSLFANWQVTSTSLSPRFIKF